jgi:dihydrofolate synthase/folylpolyglutamate synthase
MNLTSLQAWLSWLEQSHPREIDLGLERIREVASRLNLLKPQCRVITVAGTNGKGSCVTATAALLQASGKRVGLYTSPHLLHYNERIQVDGAPATDAEICQAFAAIRGAANEISLTYFEYGTLAALYVFRERAVDLMVLEVGLGGRLDAVNILDADIAVITSIDIDHQDWLGSDREVIGREKAGIIRNGKPVISVDPAPPLSIATAAADAGANLLAVNQDFSFTVDGNSWCWRGVDGTGKPLQRSNWPLPHLPLPSLAAALQAVALLGEVPDNAGEVLASVRLPGRFQRLNYLGREIILDVAHNPAASTYFVSRLQQLPIAGRTFSAVGMMSDKDRAGALANMTAVVDHWFIVDLSFLERAAPVVDLTSDLEKLGQKVSGAGDFQSCLSLIIDQSVPGDRIVIWGSFFTVAAALSAFHHLDQQARVQE